MQERQAQTTTTVRNFMSVLSGRTLSRSGLACMNLQRSNASNASDLIGGATTDVIMRGCACKPPVVHIPDRTTREKPACADLGCFPSNVWRWVVEGPAELMGALAPKTLARWRTCKGGDPKSEAWLFPGMSWSFAERPVELDVALFTKCLRNAPSGSASGPGGCTNEVQRVCLDDHELFQPTLVQSS